MRKDFIEKLNSGKILVSDGALGTMLINNGMQSGECPDYLNITKPGLPEMVAKAYFRAGSDIIFTNTFGASPLKLTDYNLQDEAEEINIAAVNIIRNIAGGSVYIAGSCGPTGRMMPPLGDTEPEEIKESYRIQAQALMTAGVDFLCFETMSDTQEAILGIQAVRELSADIPVGATMTFDKTHRGYFTFMGIDIPCAVGALEEAEADFIGSNCGNGIDNMLEIAGEIKAITSKPILIQSNAGQPQASDGQLIYQEDPGYFQPRINELINLGIAIIGGCCGSTPEHIKTIRNIVDNR